MVYHQKNILFFGDSITQQGVEANGYIIQLQQLLPEQIVKKYNLIGAGIGGNKITDLYNRLPSLLAHKPSIVIIFIGINDVWHKQTIGGTDAATFETTYQAIIDELVRENCKIMLCTPTVIGELPNNQNNLDADLDDYTTIITQLGVKNVLPIAHLRKAFTYYINQHNQLANYKGLLTTDGVHLNQKGNQLVAETMATQLINIL